MELSDITKELLIEKMDEGLTAIQLANFFSCSTSTIKRRKKEFDLVGYKTNERPLSNVELQKLESLANKGIAFNEACKEIGRTPNTVRKYIPTNIHNILKNNGFTKLSEAKRKASFAKFLEPTNFTAYIIGYLSADGNISKDGVIRALSIDYDLIKLCSNFTGANINLAKENKYYTFTAKDTRFLEQVKEISGLVPNKTYIRYEIPLWIKESPVFLEYFLVGLFNAEGWAYKVKDRKNVVEIGITQHLNQMPFLSELNSLLPLGWNEYTRESPGKATIQTKKRDTVHTFAKIYCYNEYALARKADILLRYSLLSTEM